MGLKEKVIFERDLLYLDTMRKSMDAIYMACEEISMKKKIQASLSASLEKLTVEQKGILYDLDNITDTMYRYLLDHEKNEIDIEAIINFLMGNTGVE